MSLYQQMVNLPPPRGYRGGGGSRPKVLLVHATHKIATPHGPVVAGNLVAGEYYAPHEMVGVDIGGETTWVGFDEVIGHDEIGFFKKLVKGIGKGIAKGVKGAAKVVAAPVKFTAKATHGALKITGKGLGAVAKGAKKGVKWVAKNPVKALALATPLGAGVYLAAKGVKKIAKPLGKVAKGIGKGLGAVAMAPVKLAASAFAPASPSAGPAEGAATPDGGEVPESYPGEQTPSEEAEPQPDVLEAPEPEGGDEAAEAEEAPAEGEGEEGAAETSEVSGMSEWVGLDEIAGDDDEVGYDEIAGVPAKRGKPGPNAAMVRQKGYTKSRRQPLPFASSGTVAAGASAQIVQTPQVLFRGRKLVVAAAIAASFTIDDIKVGNVSQAAAAGSMPADAFGPTTTGEDNIQMDTCPPGMQITLSVTNTSGGALQFRATLFGDAVQ